MAVERAFIDSFSQPSAADCQLAVAYTAGDATITVNNLPTDVAMKGVPFGIRIGGTIFDVTLKSGTGSKTWSVTRDTRTADNSYSIGTSVFMNHLAVDHEAMVQKGLLTGKGSLFVATAAGVITELTVGADGELLRANSAQTTGLEWVGGTGLVQLDSESPTAIGNVTLTPVAGYSSLLVRWYGQGTDAATQVLSLRFNSDSGANYDYLRQFINTAGFPAPNDGVAQTSGECGVLSKTGLTNYMHQGSIIITGYDQTTFYKTWESKCNYIEAVSAGNLFIHMATGWWRSTAAITSINIAAAAGNFATDTKFDLYGLS